MGTVGGPRPIQGEEVDRCLPGIQLPWIDFGSRRTAVFSSPQFILQEDGFDRVPEQQTDVGDIAVYFDSQGIESHAGIVVGHETLSVVGTMASMRRVPLIWSKWAKGPEYVHAVGNCPYDATTVHSYRLNWRNNANS